MTDIMFIHKFMRRKKTKIIRSYEENRFYCSVFIVDVFFFKSLDLNFLLRLTILFKAVVINGIANHEADSLFLKKTIQNEIMFALRVLSSPFRMSSIVLLLQIFLFYAYLFTFRQWNGNIVWNYECMICLYFS